MDKIILYDQVNFVGNSEEFTDSVPDLVAYHFSDKARSLKVEGKQWIGYTDTNYKGESNLYDAGEHATLGHMDKKLESLRLIV